jgi:hypothetical protein
MKATPERLLMTPSTLREAASTMTETALLDQPLEGTRSAIAKASSLAGQFVGQVQAPVIDSALQIPQAARVRWADLQQFAQREAERAGLMRAVFYYQLAQCLDVMRQVQLQAEQAGLLAGKPLQRTDELAAGMADLEDLRREVRGGWPRSQPLPDFMAGTNAAPLRMDEEGDVYVGQSSVLLDTIVEEFEAGTPPADIVRGYDTVQAADVYGAIAFYLRHKADVEAYLQRRDAEAAELWREIEATQPPKEELKAQMKERWSRRKATHASPAE